MGTGIRAYFVISKNELNLYRKFISHLAYAQLSSHRKVENARPAPRQSSSETQLSAQGHWRTSGIDLPMAADIVFAVQIDRPGIFCSKSETPNPQKQKSIRYSCFTPEQIYGGIRVQL